MPNWCTNHLVLVGDEKEINQLNDLMIELENKKEPFMPNGFGTNWLGCLANALGENWEDVRCRGDWYDHYIDTDSDQKELHIMIQYAWCACDEIIDMLERHFGSIRVYYYAEEPGCEVYETNDIEGIYFPERFTVQCYIEGDGEYDTGYFDTLSEAFNYVSGIAGVQVEKMEDLKTLNDKLEELGEYNYCNIHEINVID